MAYHPGCRSSKALNAPWPSCSSDGCNSPVLLFFSKLVIIAVALAVAAVVAVVIVVLLIVVVVPVVVLVIGLAVSVSFFMIRRTSESAS